MTAASQQSAAINVVERPDLGAAIVGELLGQQGGSLQVTVHKRRQLADALFGTKLLNVSRVYAPDASEPDSGYSKRLCHRLVFLQCFA